MAVSGIVQPTGPGRAVFCNVVTGKKFKDGGKEVGENRFDATMVFTKEEMAPVFTKFKEVAQDKWPGRDMKELKKPWVTAEKAIEDAGKRAAKKGGDPTKIATAKENAAKIFPAGTYVLKASSKFEPVLSFSDGGKIIEYTAANRANARKQFYNGTYLVPQLNLVSYVAKKVDDPDGVSAYLNLAHFVRDGEKIGGFNAADAFKQYAGAVSNEDPTGNDLDDEIPF